MSCCRLEKFADERSAAKGRGKLVSNRKIMGVVRSAQTIHPFGITVHFDNNTTSTIACESGRFIIYILKIFMYFVFCNERSWSIVQIYSPVPGRSPVRLDHCPKFFHNRETNGKNNFYIS